MQNDRHAMTTSEGKLRAPGLAGIGAGHYVLVFAPFALDAQALCRVLGDSGIDCVVCATPEELFSRIGDSALMVLVTEEALVQCPASHLSSCLEKQPAWSDMPILALAGRAGLPSEGARLHTLSRIGNVTLMERPVSRESLMMAVNAALRARLLQYRVRDQMEEMAGYARDLERRVEERTAELAREVDERRRIEMALAEARRLESIGRLTGGIAHDFNNMLHVISGNAELLRLLTGAADDARIGRAIDGIRRASANGATLTSQLLAYARRQPLSNVIVDLHQHLDQLADLLEHSLGPRIALQVDSDPKLWPVCTDLAQFDSALLNLVINARDATMGSGQVLLTLRNASLPDADFPDVPALRGDYVVVSLADQGEGMSPEIAARAFEPFFTTKPQGKGTGLGLSQVQGFAEQSGGQAIIRCGGNGTTVVLLLPRGEDASMPLPEDDTVEIVPQDAATSLAGLRVLCVDDDPAVIEVAAAMLVRLGAEVTLAASGDAAAGMELENFDVVLSDVMMPGKLDGIGLARHVQKRRPGLPVVLASGFVLEPRRLDGLDVVFLQKPYSTAQVDGAVRRALATR